MRFDEERVGALFRRAEHCFTDAEFRAIVKSHSSLPIERKDIRLADLLIDIQLLLENCLMHFATKGAYDTIINIRKEEYYRINEKNCYGDARICKRRFFGFASSGGPFPRK